MRRLSPPAVVVACLLACVATGNAAPPAPLTAPATAPLPATPPASAAKPAAKVAPAAGVPTVFATALPAHVAFIAWLPADKSPDEPEQIDLDLRVEVVLPTDCGDKVAGLLRRSGMKLDGADNYEAVVELHEVGECKKEATRIGARTTIRMKLKDGATRELSIGAMTLKVARAGKKVTVDGGDPEGDMPGAPPSGRPTALVLGEVTAAKVTSAARIQGAQRAARADVDVTAKWPACAGAPVGFLASGDAKTHFALSHFEPLARAPLDEACRTAATKTTRISAVVQLAKKTDKAAITVGRIELALPLLPPPVAR